MIGNICQVIVSNVLTGLWAGALLKQGTCPETRRGQIFRGRCLFSPRPFILNVFCIPGCIQLPEGVFHYCAGDGTVAKPGCQWQAAPPSQGDH